MRSYAKISMKLVVNLGHGNRLFILLFIKYSPIFIFLLQFGIQTALGLARDASWRRQEVPAQDQK
jgi:hypothetical protein